MMTTKLLMATLAALSILGASVAEAASRKGKHHKVTRAPPVAHGAAPYAYRATPEGYPTRPAWAGPNQCFTDEGYGRFTPCDTGKDH